MDARHRSCDRSRRNGILNFTAIQEQLGLRLVSGKSPVQLVVVDSIEKYPTDN
jgi:uncharacterized protein (TIGR03435 family)